MKVYYLTPVSAVKVCFLMSVIAVKAYYLRVLITAKLCNITPVIAVKAYFLRVLIAAKICYLTETFPNFPKIRIESETCFSCSL